MNEGVQTKKASGEPACACAHAHTLQAITAASSGTHTQVRRAGSLAWRSLARPSAGCEGYRRGAAEIPAGESGSR